jgi:hypothetical protein
MKRPFALWAPVVVLPLLWAHKVVDMTTDVKSALFGAAAALIVVQFVCFFENLRSGNSAE